MYQRLNFWQVDRKISISISKIKLSNKIHEQVVHLSK